MAFHRGADISLLSQFAAECEVLGSPGERLDITAWSRADGVFRVPVEIGAGGIAPLRLAPPQS